MSDRLAARFLVLFLMAGTVFPSGPQEKPGLSPRHNRWLKEEVVYIISEKEKAVFLALESEGDRDLFIEEFWRQRDPIPGTPRNEFRDEHDRRIEFANQTFRPRNAHGRVADRPGPLLHHAGPAGRRRTVPDRIRRHPSGGALVLPRQPRLRLAGRLPAPFFPEIRRGGFRALRSHVGSAVRSRPPHRSQDGAGLFYYGGERQGWRVIGEADRRSRRMSIGASRINKPMPSFESSVRSSWPRRRSPSGRGRPTRKSSRPRP